MNRRSLKRYPTAVLMEAHAENYRRTHYPFRREQLVQQLANEGYFGGSLGISRFLDLLDREERQVEHYVPLHHTGEGVWPPLLHKFYNLKAVKALIAEDAARRLGGTVERGQHG